MKQKPTKPLKIIKKFTSFFPIGQPRYNLFLGWQAWLKGDTNKAITSLTKSIQSAKDLQMPFDEGVAHYMLARIVPESVLRQQYVQQAKALFSDINAGYYLQRIESE